MLERLEQLEKNIFELEKFKSDLSIGDIKDNIRLQWSLRYGLFESVQIVIDLSCHLSSYYNLGNPKTYSDCVELLVEHNYLSKTLGEKLIGMIGLRNILIHEYVKIEMERLYSLLNNLEDFKAFVSEIREIIK
jgi:uncharacterized protein YutE (UPF0331/DUF86 family)